MAVNQQRWIVVLIVFPLLALGTLFYILHVKNQHPSEVKNHAKTPLEFKDNTVQCPQCFMYLVGEKHTAQIIDGKGKTTFFDDIGCAILWLKEQKIEPKNVVIWAFSLDTHRYIDAFKAYYTLTESTPMLYGFGAYENPKEASVDFWEMRLKMLRGENMSDPKVRQKLLGREP
jgi:copper chaperone NosL